MIGECPQPNEHHGLDANAHGRRVQRKARGRDPQRAELNLTNIVRVLMVAGLGVIEGVDTYRRRHRQYDERDEDVHGCASESL